MFGNKTFKLKQVYYEQVTPAWDIMKLHFPQECSEMKNRDVPSTLDFLHTSNDGSTTQAGTITAGTDVISGTSNQFIGINNNLMHKEMNSTNSDSKSLEFRHTLKRMCSIRKTNKAEQLSCTCSVLRNSRKYRPYARKGMQGPYVHNCKDQYVTSKRGKENHLYSSSTCQQDNGNQITRVSNADSALEDSSNDSMSIDSDIAAIAKDTNVISPVSSLDDSFCDSPGSLEDICSYELDCSVMLEGGRTEGQEASDINSYNKDSTQFTSDATGTLTPFAAHEDGLSVMCPRTKEIYNIDDIINKFKTVSPISRLDDSCSEMSDIIEDFTNFELHYSKTLEDVGIEIQKLVDINDHNTDSTQFISTATGTLTPFAAHEDGPIVMCPRTKEIYDIYDTKELITVSPISSLDVSCYEMSHMENIRSYELDCSVMLEGGRTEGHEASDINSYNKDSTQFTSDATGTLTPFAAHEDGLFVMCPRTKEIYKIDGIINEYKIVCPISRLDDSCFEMSDIIEDFTNFELRYFKTLEDVGT